MSTLVAAPTGSGKTVVAEFAIERALDRGGKAFYTTPLKALSNQKFGDLVAKHGAESVGLLTGDNAINPDASVVVMTTEVLRNMLYERSSTLTGLLAVVMDEVHYLQDPYRGAVWEEVLIHLPPSVTRGRPLRDDLERGGVRRVDHDPPRRHARRHRGAASRAARAPLPGRLAPASDARRAGRDPPAEPVRRLARSARAEDEDLLPAWVGVSATSADLAAARGIPAGLRPPARRGRRGPRSGRDAAGDLLRLQQIRLRQERAMAPGRRRAPHDEGGVGDDPRPGRDPRGVGRR